MYDLAGAHEPSCMGVSCDCRPSANISRRCSIRPELGRAESSAMDMRFLDWEYEYGDVSAVSGFKEYQGIGGT